MNQFDDHWRSRGYDRPPTAKLRAADRFLAPLVEAMAAGTLGAGPHLLDMGCGDGVHAMILARHARQFEYVGVDISKVAVSLCRKQLPDPRMRFLVADGTSLPFPDARFDAVIAFGVVAYLRDPSAALRELARVLRPGGYLGLWVYPGTNGIMSKLFSMARGVCRMAGPGFTRVVVKAIVPFMRWLPVSSGVHLGNASWRQCEEVVMVNIVPRELHLPGREEVISWVTGAGLEIVREDPSSPVTMWAVRR